MPASHISWHIRCRADRGFAYGAHGVILRKDIIPEGSPLKVIGMGHCRHSLQRSSLLDPLSEDYDEQHLRSNFGRSEHLGDMLDVETDTA